MISITDSWSIKHLNTIFPSGESLAFLKYFEVVPFGFTSFYVVKGSYSNNSITTTFIQTVTYNTRFQTLSPVHFYITFFKGNLVRLSEIDQTPAPNAHVNFHVNTSFNPVDTCAIRTISLLRTLCIPHGSLAITNKGPHSTDIYCFASWAIGIGNGEVIIINIH